MLFSFNFKKKQEPAGPNDVQDRMAPKIVYHCIRWQLKWAAWIQHKAARLSDRGKVMVLSLFCLLAGGYSGFLAVSSFSGELPLTRVGQPGSLYRSANANSQAPLVITEEEHREIQGFRQYMDSLAQTISGKKFQDSMLATRPGLMDSVLLFENLYQSQIKNKP